jgi:hypothetical protein
MRRALPLFLALTLGLSGVTSISSAYSVRSYQQQDQYSDEYQDQAQDLDGLDADETGEDDASPIRRVARLRFVEGDVSFLRAGVTDWAPAVENLPLLEGDQLYVPRGARAEIQLSGGSFVRLSEQATLTITELSDLAAQFELTEGTAVIVADRLNAGKERLEVDTPNAALILAQDGMYRVNIQGPEQTDVSVRKGNVEVSTEDGSFRVREGYRLTVDTSYTGHLQLAADTGIDWWNEDWTDRSSSSGTFSVQSLPDDVDSDVQAYESNYTGFYGASDLSNYGTWTNDASYGNCWFPRVSSDWAPYRYGQWLWIPSVGWSWLPEERWGWAPYHYGRWAFVPGRGWAWVPGFARGRGYGHWDYRWRPHLVYFFNSSNSRGRYVGWYPLSPRQRWHRADWNRRNDHRHLQYPNGRDRNRRPGDGNDRNRRSPRAITAVPIEAFQRPTRSIDRRDLIDRDSTRWIARNVKPGLPEVTPTPMAARPGGDRREGRRVLTPSTEVISRSVVTRHRPGNSLAESNVRRERKLLLPKPVQPVETFGRMRNRDRNEGDPASTRRGRVATGDVDSNDNAGGNDGTRREGRSKPRITLPAPAEKRNGENESFGGPGGTDPAEKSAEQRRAEKQERKRLRDQEQPEQNSNPASNAEAEQRRAEKQERKRLRDQEQQQQSSNPASNRNNEQPRVRSENHNQPRNESRSETKSEAKQERRQERQQAREERSAPHGKPGKNR